MLMRQRLLFVACAAMLIAFGWALFGPARHVEAASGGFVAPLPLPLTVLRGFDPPSEPWLPGNRGVDLAATTGEPVVAAADGVVLYAGLLAGRGVVSISHGDVRTTYEPVDTAVTRGESVRRGEEIGQVSAVSDGCGPPGGCLHWGAIRGDSYLDPMSLLAASTVRLLPIWAGGFPTAAPASDSAAGTHSAAANPSAAVAASTATARFEGHHRDTRFTVVSATIATTASVGAATAVAGLRRARSPVRP
jgi:hypothetical protein